MAIPPISSDLTVLQIGEDDESCNFRYNPEQWGNPEDANLPKSCPYDSVPGLSFCIFHLLPRHRQQLYGTVENINRQYIRAIASKRVLYLTCTTISAASLSTVIKAIPTELNIELLFANIRGELDLSNVEISNRFNITHCFISKLTLSQSTLNKELRISDSSIDEFSANAATFKRHCRFSEVEFGTVHVLDANFQRYVQFHESGPEDAEIREISEVIGEKACTFRETASFMGTEFSRGALFDGVVFEQSALFGHTEFPRGASFYGVEAGTGVDFNNAYFGDHVTFNKSDLGIAAFYYCDFDKSVSFENATFGNEYTMFLINAQNGESFSTDKVHELAVRHRDRVENVFVKHYTDQMHNFAVLFNQTTVGGEVNLIDAELKGGMRADLTNFESIRIRLSSPLTTTTSLFHRSTLNGGELHMDNQNCFIELRNATLGPVEITTEDDNNPFNNIYFDGTNYDGFEFSDYRDVLEEIDWKIEGAYVENEHMGAMRQETTYSKAKTGASELGDRLAESKFSILEGRSRRARYREQLNPENSLTNIPSNALKFTINGFYDLLSVYGESPQRVFAWSVASVAAYSLVLNYLIDWSTNSTLYPLQGLGVEEMGYSLSSLVFSIQSFTSFLVGQSIGELSTEVRLVASSESFIGAFFISLFVATVVRKIKR